ncbi:MAG: CDP-alcohol phosphatidyltransferase family protein [Candidatus Aenigmatarchaeota archaeon]
MVKHGKLGIVKNLRKFTDAAVIGLPLPKISPNFVSGMSILAGIAFVLSLHYSTAIAFVALAANLLLDWFDGIIAKKYGLVSEKGYMVDVFADRLSEGIIFAPFFTPWFYLFALNNALSVCSFTNHKHVILPLRHIFLVYFFLAFVI